MSKRAHLHTSYESAELTRPPILKLSRAYCVLAIGAALLISVCFYVNSASLGDNAGFSRLIIILNWVGLIMLVGAIIYGFRMARQAKVDAARNAELLQEAKQRTMEIAALYDTSQDVAVKNELTAMLEVILERAKTLLGAAGCAIFLYDKEHDDFQIAVEVGVGMPIGTHLSRYEGLAGRVAETREPLIINDYQTWPFRSKTLMQLPIRAVVCVPMVRGGELIGVLGVHEVGGTVRTFTEADARLLSIFGDNAAGAVHNARLLDALHNSEERFRIAAGCASDIVYDWDLTADRVDYFGVLFERSRANNTIIARTRKEYWDLVHPEDRQRVQDALREHFETGKPFSQEYRIGTGKGTYFNVSDRATAIRNQKGHPIRLIGAVSDITARKQAEQMKSDFVSFVTHQLRTPLSGVKWLLELATDVIDDPDEVKSLIQDARTSTERLIRLVNDLLDVSRLERGKLQLNYTNINLADLTAEVVNEMMPLITERRQNLSTKSAPGLPLVRVDSQMLRQVMLNLISNAMKYTPSGGKIDIRIDRKNDSLVWSIQDTGIGIPRAERGKLFEKFYRAGNVLAVETEGTGLGLYLVRLIVEKFGGRVWCDSEEGVGSTFLFTLPISDQRST